MESGMNEAVPGVRFEFFDTIDSTNSEAKRRLSALPPESCRSLHKTVLVAQRQSAGRGRLGRTFYSPPGTGLYFSLIYADGELTEPGITTAVSAVAVCRAIRTVFSVDTSIKWVNDVFVGGKKVCGILTEGITGAQSGAITALVIGIGINIFFSSAFPPELSSRAGGICGSVPADGFSSDAAQLAAQKNLLLRCTVDNLITILDNPAAECAGAIKEYRLRSNLIGKTVAVSPVADSPDGQYEAAVIGITDNAELIVRTPDGAQKTLCSGEVTLHTSQHFSEGRNSFAADP